MKRKLIILGLVLFGIVIQAKAQIDLSKICRLEDGKLYFELDKVWTEAEKKEISRIFDLDSLLFAEVFKGLPFITVDSTTWEIKVLEPGKVEISKMFAPPPPSLKTTGNSIMIMDNAWFDKPVFQPREDIVFGVNEFTDRRAFSYNDSIATFFLADYPEARKVQLSGSFNNWGTLQPSMIKTDSGWIQKMNLQPGRYEYKFIVDGSWMRDLNNKLKEDDTYGSFNSVVYCYNYVFRLRGYQQARTVILSGSFNGWNEKALKMKKTAEGWELPVYLKDGTHTYKFIVDKQWVRDPDNPIQLIDGNDDYNSVQAIGDTNVFHLNGFKDAHEVKLAGSFNAWNPDELFMRRDSSGWSLPYVLAKGNYEYKFIVDGQWMGDPDNPSSASNNDGNSFMAFKPNYVFELDSFPDAREVVVTGSFSNWSPGSYRMRRQNGKWVLPIYLSPGKTTYKFVVDGNWILDPANALWEENEYNTHNSLLWIEP
ncbi:MAG: glycogen-binding domain-containing protein [Bacteroidales bacterium]|nr:glycogen-binding domain-containing protein [Bacteroidales bacterium]